MTFRHWYEVRYVRDGWHIRQCGKGKPSMKGETYGDRWSAKRGAMRRRVRDGHPLWPVRLFSRDGAYAYTVI